MLRLTAAPHAFALRGVPGAGEAEAFDVTYTAEPDAAAARLLEALGCEDRVWMAVHQVHGGEVLTVDASGTTPAPGTLAQADALITADPRVMLAIRVADCGNVLLATSDGRGVAAIHAGWRGVVAGIVPAAVAALSDLVSADPSDLAAAMGPCIGLEAFEVGPEVAQAFDEAGLANAVVRRPDWRRPHIDLNQAIRSQLLIAGLDDARIDALDQCTVESSASCHSFRRDKDRSGRMAAVIGPRA